MFESIVDVSRKSEIPINLPILSYRFMIIYLYLIHNINSIFLVTLLQ